MSACILIESGRVTSSDRAELVGQWCHFVSYVDGEGGSSCEFVATSKFAAEDHANSLAKACALPVVDRSDAEVPV